MTSTNLIKYLPLWASVSPSLKPNKQQQQRSSGASLSLWGKLKTHGIHSAPVLPQAPCYTPYNRLLRTLFISPLDSGLIVLRPASGPLPFYWKISSSPEPEAPHSLQSHLHGSWQSRARTTCRATSGSCVPSLECLHLHLTELPRVRAGMGLIPRVGGRNGQVVAST